MSIRQLLALCVCQLAAFTAGSSAIILFALHGSRLGASESDIGNALALLFVALAVGSLVAGRLSDRFQRRKLTFTISSSLMALFIFLMSQAGTFGQLTVMLALAGLFAGIANVMVFILASLFVGEHERGRVFGLLTVMISLGQVISGWAAGPIVDRWGFSGLYILAATVELVAPFSILLVRDKVVPRAAPGTVSNRDFWKSRAFRLLLISTLGTWAVFSAPGVIRPLIMDRLHFDATAISSTIGLASMVALPIPFIMGWLSDRVGRKSLLIFCCVANAAGLLLFLPAALIWHFWLASTIQSLASGANAVGPALVTDLVPKQSVGGALSIYSACQWIGQVIGSAGIGFLTQQLGMSGALTVGVIIALLSAVIILPIVPRTELTVAVAADSTG